LLLRGDFGNPASIGITIDSSGAWQANDFDFSHADPYAAFGDSTAIQTGDGATNTLLVAMHGPQYLIFVNGQYLGAYFHAPARPGPSPSGAAMPP
jgi:hypothetical protein